MQNKKFIYHAPFYHNFYVLNRLLCWDEKVIPYPLNASKGNSFIFNKNSWIGCRPRKLKPKVSNFRSDLLIKHTFMFLWTLRISSNFFLHCKLCYHYFEIKLFLSSTSTESITLLDCYCLEIILSKLSFAGSTRHYCYC